MKSLHSAWNGALEVHQNINGKEVIDTIPDMREYVASEHTLNSFSADGETFVYMRPGDSFIYIPSSSMNAMEIPIKPFEGTTPGFIMYLPIGQNLSDSTIQIRYTFHRLVTSDPLFWISVTGMVSPGNLLYPQNRHTVPTYFILFHLDFDYLKGFTMLEIT